MMSAQRLSRPFCGILGTLCWLCAALLSCEEGLSLFTGSFESAGWDLGYSGIEGGGTGVKDLKAVVGTCVADLGGSGANRFLRELKSLLILRSSIAGWLGVAAVKVGMTGRGIGV